jgi:hypothetical protein
LKLVFQVGFRCEPPDNPRLAFVAAVNHVNVVSLVAGIQVSIQVVGGVGVLRKYEPLAFFERHFIKNPFEFWLTV